MLWDFPEKKLSESFICYTYWKYSLYFVRALRQHISFFVVVVAVVILTVCSGIYFSLFGETVYFDMVHSLGNIKKTMVYEVSYCLIFLLLNSYQLEFLSKGFTMQSRKMTFNLITFELNVFFSVHNCFYVENNCELSALD